MGTSSSMIFQLSFFFTTIFFYFQTSDSKLVLVDGLEEWKNPSVAVGDTIIFKHKHDYSLYIFRNRRAFKFCNFSEATLLTNPNSNSFTWHPSRPGFFYFLFSNGSLNACNQSGDKFPVKVVSESAAFSPQFSPQAVAPSPDNGGVVSSSPVYHWPLRSPHATSPRAATTTPTTATRSTVPPLLPDTGGGIPFIKSNPALPLPTGESDAATIHPLPTSASHGPPMVGLLATQIPVACVVWTLLFC